MGRSPADNAETLKQEIRDYIHTIKRHRGIGATPSARVLGPLVTVYDVALVQACDLSNFALQNVRWRTRLIWPRASLPRRPAPNDVLYTLTSNLAHAVQAVRFLLLYGFGHQARSALRDVVELADLILVVLYDEDVYRDYITAIEEIEQETKHWRSKLAPAEMRKRLERLDEEVGPARFAGRPPADFRRGMYRLLSTFSHVSYVSHVVSSGFWETTSHTPDPNKDYVTPMAFLGRAGEFERDALRTALTYLMVFFVYLDEILWTKHGWGRLRGPRARGWFRYRAQVLHMLVAEAAKRSL